MNSTFVCGKSNALKFTPSFDIKCIVCSIGLSECAGYEEWGPLLSDVSNFCAKEKLTLHGTDVGVLQSIL